MRRMRNAALAALACKAIVLGALAPRWWTPAAQAESAPSAAAAAEPLPGESGVPGDLLARSRGFRDILEAVRERGTDLDRREQALASRESALKTLEKTLADEIARLEALSRTVAARGGGGEAPGGALAGPALTKIYESMRAEEAGPILDRLDDATVKAILGRMKERQVGAILAAMSRDRAVAFTRALAAGAAR